MAEKQCNLIKNGGGMSKYSTSEVLTGEFWIDGKPIYRQVIESSTPANAGSNTVIETIAPGRNVFNMYGLIYLSAATRIPINFYQSATVYVSSYYSESSTEGRINMQVGPSTYTGKDVKIILEYTKT